MNKTTASTIGLLTATLAWGASFFLVKKAIFMVGVWPYLTYRFVFCAGFMILVFPKKVVKVSLRMLGRTFILGTFLFLSIWTQTVGLQWTTATRSGFLTALYVPLTPLMGWIILRQKAHWKQMGIACLAMAGLYLLTSPKDGSASFLEWWGKVNVGDLWTVGTALAGAIQIVYTEKFSRLEKDSIGLGLWQFLWCTAEILLAVSFLKPAGGSNVWRLSLWPTFALGSALFNALICTCFAFIMQIIAQKTMGSLKTALICALEAPFSSLFAYSFLGEVMTFREMTGAAIVFLTSIIPEGWLKTSIKE